MPETEYAAEAGPPLQAPRDLTDKDVAENLLKDAHRELKMMREQLALCHAKLGVLDLVDRLVGQGNRPMSMVTYGGVEYTIERWLQEKKRRSDYYERMEKFKQQTAQPSRFDEVGDELGRDTAGREGY